MELVKINPSDYGLEENKAKQISDMFKPMLDKMVELEGEYNEVMKTEISPEACIEAKALRLKYVKVRTGTASIHKELKAFYLQGGRFVDGWKNAQLMASQGIEDKLSSIENHFENLEKEKIEKLQNERLVELHKYEPEMNMSNLGDMNEDVWKNYISGVKMNYQARIEAEKKAEQERIEKEEKQRLHENRKNELIPYWNHIDNNSNTFFGDLSNDEFLEVLNTAKEAKIAHEKEQERVRIENEKLQKESEEKEKKRIAEQKKAQEAAEKAQREFDAEMKKQREEKERIENELRLKKEAEEKAEKERQAKIEVELNKGDEEKVKDLINDLIALKTKYSFQSVKNQAMYKVVSEKLSNIINSV